jgi:electron transfer flavoprotein beta subunit
MLIAVCLKQVLTRESHLRINDDRTWVRDETGTCELNEPDGYALEEALRLRDAHGGEVVVLSAGPDRVTEILREALARGADRAIHVRRDGGRRFDARQTATALAEVVRGEPYDLVLTGLQSDDQGLASVGVILAELAGMPHATIITDIRVDGSGLRVKRELEGGWSQWIAMPRPALLTIQSGINRLRYATLRGIMAAKKKDIRVVDAPSDPGPGLRIRSVYLPERRKVTRFLTGTGAEAGRELVRLLRDDARVIE